MKKFATMFSSRNICITTGFCSPTCRICRNHGHCSNDDKGSQGNDLQRC